MHILDFFLQYLIDIEVSSKGGIFTNPSSNNAIPKLLKMNKHDPLPSSTSTNLAWTSYYPFLEGIPRSLLGMFRYGCWRAGRSPEVSQSSRVGGSKGLEINSLVIPITYAIRSLFATTSCIYAEPCCLLAASLSSSTPPLPFSNNAPLPETLLAIRRFTSAPMNPRVQLAVWTSNPVHKWIPVTVPTGR